MSPEGYGKEVVVGWDVYQQAIKTTTNVLRAVPGQE
jgi:hypothetical protein